MDGQRRAPDRARCDGQAHGGMPDRMLAVLEGSVAQAGDRRRRAGRPREPTPAPDRQRRTRQMLEIATQQGTWTRRRGALLLPGDGAAAGGSQRCRFLDLRQYVIGSADRQRRLRRAAAQPSCSDSSTLPERSRRVLPQCLRSRTAWPGASSRARPVGRDTDRANSICSRANSSASSPRTEIVQTLDAKTGSIAGWVSRKRWR